MRQLLRRNPGALGTALLLHLILAVLTLAGVDWLASAEKLPTRPRIVQAKVVDAGALEAEITARHQAKAETQRQAAAEAEAQRRAEAQRQAAAEAEAQRRAEAKRQAEAEAQRQAEAKRRAAAEARRQAEAKRQADAEARRQAEAKRRAAAEAQRQAEAKRQADAEARRQAEAKRQAEAEAKRQAEAEAQRRAEAEANLLAALDAEQAASELDIYKSAIQERIRRVWVRQPGMGRDLSCQVEARIIPGGQVIPGSVHIIRGSGNPAFDRSVMTAVYKASPLPVPAGRPFEQFRNLRLEFKP
ncbi:MAG: cell envelope integrity protein TolA [Candidatus Thiosymbion ectosymbiont of Robbea hypermnestra]|nr:cell envelope integrity protein TolA [Candidatus Thiosymbion ectosymbiont of Robbea hypermnestra]